MHRIPRALACACLLIGMMLGALPARAASVAEVAIGGETFTLELALDAAARSRGLMYRDHIAADGGMLFVFPNVARRHFWMKNCPVDMDILFLDDDGVITTIMEMYAEPPRGENESIAAYHAKAAALSERRAGALRDRTQARHGRTARPRHRDAAGPRPRGAGVAGEVGLRQAPSARGGRAIQGPDMRGVEEGVGGDGLEGAIQALPGQLHPGVVARRDTHGQREVGEHRRG
ncbi:MAG: DUF192 domain-containing protein [Gammaproteobacteria bacterium]|nr:DUF192 domain-containing protein [Gammaproteobacteria bacterium]